MNNKHIIITCIIYFIEYLCLYFESLYLPSDIFNLLANNIEYASRLIGTKFAHYSNFYIYFDFTTLFTVLNNFINPILTLLFFFWYIIKGYITELLSYQEYFYFWIFLGSVIIVSLILLLIYKYRIIIRSLCKCTKSTCFKNFFGNQLQ
jgi:hypothetical protein